MAQNDMHSELSVDSILSEVKHMRGEDTGKLWTLREVEALLMRDKSRAEPVNIKNGDLKSAARKAAGVSTEPASSAQTPSVETLRLDSEYAVSPDTQELSDLLSSSEESASSAKRPARSVESVLLEESVQSDEPAPLLTGTAPKSDETPQIDEKPEPQPIPGQIHMDKTRVFNEVETHAVHNAQIEHRIGQKVVRTTTGEFDPLPKKSVMETDPRRERFLNRPTQQLEKTTEHKRLLEQLPPKTIEKPGVIVKKGPEKTGSDGLQAIPTLVMPEDEWQAQKEQETRVQEGSLKSYAFQNPVDADEPLEDQMVLDGFDTEEESVRQIDEEQAEQSLLARRREKAQKFRLFPGLSPSKPKENEDDLPDGEADDVEEAQEDTDETSADTVTFDLSDELREHSGDTGDLNGEGEPKPSRRRRKPAADDEPISVLREYYGPKDTRAVTSLLQAEKRGYGVRLLLSVILMLAALCSSFLVRLTDSFALFNDSAAVYSAVQTVFVFLMAAVSFPACKAAIGQIIRMRRLSAETGVLCALLFSLLQTAVSFAYPEQLTQLSIYTSVAGLSCVLYYAGKRGKLKADLRNFEMVAENHDRFHGIFKIDDPDTAFEIGRGLLLGDPDVLYSRPIAFPAKFVETSKRNDRAFDVYTYALPAVLFAAGLIAAITCLVTRDVFMSVSALTAVALGGLPLAEVCASASALSSVNQKLQAEGAMLSGYDAAFGLLTANAVVLDASDLFDNAGCVLRGMKIFHKMRVDEALLYTAAMVIQSGGTLSSVFDGVILSKREMLPQVESLAYEERLGCSGWIYNQRVLVGNRELLEKHNVDAPSREEEQRFRKDGCEVLYLAVEGKTAALFVIEYAANERLTSYLQKLEQYGVSILVRTSDPNITEGLIEQYFRLPHNLVKIINPVAGSMFLALSEEEPKTEPCSVLHSGRTASFLRALVAAFVLEEKYRLSQILLYIGVGLSVTLLAVLSFFTGLKQAGELEILVFELIWAAIVVGIPKLKRV